MKTLLRETLEITFIDLYKRNQNVIYDLTKIIKDKTTPATLVIALRHLRQNLLAPSETALLYNDINK